MNIKHNAILKGKIVCEIKMLVFLALSSHFVPLRRLGLNAEHIIGVICRFFFTVITVSLGKIFKNVSLSNFWKLKNVYHLPSGVQSIKYYLDDVTQNSASNHLQTSINWLYLLKISHLAHYITQGYRSTRFV
jgi:putative lipase involved disintegration of autophagic bodies